MATNKKSFVLYTDLIHTVNLATDEQAGILFKHILSYVNDEQPIAECITTKILFEPVKQQLKRDLQKYEKKKEQWSDAGKRSAELRNAKKKQRTLTDVASRSTDSTVNDNVNVNVNDINTTTEAVVDFNLIDLWIVNLKNETIYLEGLYRLYKLKEGSISKIILKFKEHLKIYPKQHVDISDFKKHFASWVRLKINNKELTEFCKHQKGEL
jgi:hypothetical protein